jgi:hypothetical protein
MAKITYKKESYAVMGACFEVYNEKGCGFLESLFPVFLLICSRLFALFAGWPARGFPDF